MKIGQKIKIRRSEMKMTQKELAEGICTQSQISKIEKDEITPLSTLLVSIANKLEVSLDYLIGNGNDNDNNGITLDQNHIYNLLKERKYKEVEVLLSPINEQKLTFEDNIFYKYITLIIKRYLYNENITNNLKGLLDTNKEYISDILMINILNSLGIFYMEDSMYNNSEKCFEKANSIIFIKKIDSDLSFKIMYNHMRLLFEENKFKELYTVSTEAIEYSFQKNSMLCIAEFIYFKCFSLIELNSKNIIDLTEVNFALYVVTKKKNIYMHNKIKEIKEKIKSLE